MVNNGTKLIVFVGLMAAMVAVATLIVQIPSPIGGFFNIGDSMVILSGLILGPIGGFLAGGIGSALGDILPGWFMWAPWTFVVKGLEGLVVGLIAYKAYRGNGNWFIRCLIGAIFGVAIMVLGYWIAAGFIYGHIGAGTPELLGNTIQGGASLIIATVLGTALRKVVSSKTE